MRNKGILLYSVKLGVQSVEETTLIKENIFLQCFQKQSLFLNKKILTSSFIPERIEFRENEIKQTRNILSSILRGYDANNIFIHGTCGTGKTICVKYIAKQLEEAASHTGNGIVVVYINCKMKRVADTEYRMLAQILKEMGENVPDTGLPTDVLYRKFFDKVDSKQQTVVLIVDEIDTLFKKIGDDFLYNLTRINTDLKKSHITIIGITNDLLFRDKLDMRIRSSLAVEEILFTPYDAFQLKNILSERVKQGFVVDTVTDEVISKCAAMAAREHGDARRALDLLRVAGEIAERDGRSVVLEEHVDLAEQKINIDNVIESVKTQPRHSQAVLFSIIYLEKKKAGKWTDARLLTGDIFTMYQKVCLTNGLNVLTQRRVSDLIGELDMLGIITTKVISKGRHGRTREISLSLSDNILEKIDTFLSGVFVA